MFYASSPIDTRVSSSLINSGLLSHSLPGSPGCESLFFASPKKSNQKKGDPQSGPLRGSLKYSVETEILETSRPCRRRTSKIFNPSRLNISSPASTGGGQKPGSKSESPHPNPLPEGEGTNTRPALRIPHYPLSLWERAGVRASPNLYLNPLPQLVLAGLKKAGGDGLKNLDVRRQRSWLVSRFSGSFSFFKEPRRGPDCGSPFLS